MNRIILSAALYLTSLTTLWAQGFTLSVTPPIQHGSGTHRARIDTRDIPSGVYFLRAETGGIVDSRPVTIVR